MSHRFKLVENFFFANTETFERKSLSFGVFEFNSHIQAAFVEITSSLEVVECLKLVCNSYVRLETFLELAFSLVAFTIYQLVF